MSQSFSTDALVTLQEHEESLLEAFATAIPQLLEAKLLPGECLKDIIDMLDRHIECLGLLPVCDYYQAMLARVPMSRDRRAVNYSRESRELTEEDAVGYFEPWLNHKGNNLASLSPSRVTIICGLICGFYDAPLVEYGPPQRQLLRLSQLIWTRHGHLPPLDVVHEISQNNVVEIPGFRVTHGRNFDTMKIKMQHEYDWQVVLEAVPCFIWAVYQRLRRGDKAAYHAMIINCRGERERFEDVCGLCSEEGVLLGGCIRWRNFRGGACSNCVFKGREALCTLALVKNIEKLDN